MDTKIIEKINKDLNKIRPDIRIGDTVKLNLKIKEGNKERIQVFEGIVISKSGSGINKTITVRKMSYGIGVERIVPLHSPTLDSVKIIKKGNVKRSKLYYLRSKIGKKALEVNSEYVKEEIVVPSTGEIQTEAIEVEEESKEEAPAEVKIEETNDVKVETPNQENVRAEVGSTSSPSDTKEENVVKEKKEEVAVVEEKNEETQDNV